MCVAAKGVVGMTAARGHAGSGVCGWHVGSAVGVEVCCSLLWCCDVCVGRNPGLTWGALPLRQLITHTLSASSQRSQHITCKSVQDMSISSKDQVPLQAGCQE
jgi:hypothetical protein